MKTVFISSRRFLVWAYSVSHASLVMRSVKDDVSKSRIDLVFFDVNAMNIQCEMDGVEILEVKVAEGRSILAIRNQNFEGLVNCSSMRVFEDGGEYYDNVIWDFHNPPGLSKS